MFGTTTGQSQALLDAHRLLATRRPKPLPDLLK
jgi:hypothetical protein